MPNTRIRAWVFTKNNYTDDDEDIIFDLSFKCQYIIAAKEVGESGTPHFQGFIQFETVKSFDQVKASLPDGSHFEPMRGLHSEAISYCKKGEQSKFEWENFKCDGPSYGLNADWFEHGTQPLDVSDGGRLEKVRWDEAIANVILGNWAAVPTDMGVRYGKGLEFLANKRNKFNLAETDAQMLWYYGEAGSGKSRKARNDHPDAYIKMANKWWDDYKGQEVVIIEDFDVRHEVLAHHVKLWGDRYCFPAEYKGGKMDIRPRLIIVTSNWHPNEIWHDQHDLVPILRRFKTVKFMKPLTTDPPAQWANVDETVINN